MKKIVILGNSLGANGDLDLTVLFRLTCPATIQQAMPGAVSQIPGATAAEDAEVASGAVLEQTWEGQLPKSLTLAQIRTGLVTEFNRRQAALDARALASRYVGAYWDGSTWTAA